MKTLWSKTLVAALVCCLSAPAVAAAYETPVLTKPSKKPYEIKIIGFRAFGKKRIEEFTIQKYSDGHGLERTDLNRSAFGVNISKILDFNKGKVYTLYPAARQYKVAKLAAGPVAITDMKIATKEKSAKVVFGVKCSTWIMRTACPITMCTIADDLGVVLSKVVHHNLGQTGFEAVSLKLKAPAPALFMVPKDYVEIKRTSPSTSTSADQNEPLELSL
ncbi:hypothetical protein GC174_03855 [bacterium]|nr:hypothetical protein [bacterium]